MRQYRVIDSISGKTYDYPSKYWATLAANRLIAKYEAEGRVDAKQLIKCIEVE